MFHVLFIMHVVKQNELKMNLGHEVSDDMYCNTCPSLLFMS